MILYCMLKPNYIVHLKICHVIFCVIKEDDSAFTHSFEGRYK